jgi:hypothetical protein
MEGAMWMIFLEVGIAAALALAVLWALRPCVEAGGGAENEAGAGDGDE